MSSTATPADDWPLSTIVPRARVITDNDYAGDPDGLVQLAHLLLSPSVDTRFVLGSHLRAGDGWALGLGDDTAAAAADAATEVARRCGRSDVPVLAGSPVKMAAPDRPVRNAAVDALIHEAMRDDTDLPLYVVCGGGLTEIASAWLVEPRIAERLTLVWIGGHEHDGLAEPPLPGMDLEYNLHIDTDAGQVVFNDSNLPIWQVPRDVYRRCGASRAELLVRMQPLGELGAYLFAALGRVAQLTGVHGLRTGELYVLGDSPLVLLTALQTMFEPGPASSDWVTRPCPRILPSGRYEDRPDGRPLRIFTRLDVRLMFEDMYAKLALHAMTEG